MTTRIDRRTTDAFSRFLRDQLTLSPARGRRMLRMAAGTAIVVAVAMTFRIPLPAYAAYLVFLVSQEDAASTLIAAAGGLVAATMAVAISLLFYVFDAAAPALRLPLLALSAFAGTFFSRTSALGPMAFLSGYILVLSQTLADDTPATEPLTHGVLWLWVVVALPVTVTVAMDLLLGESPSALSRRRAAELFERVAGLVENPHWSSPEPLRGDLLALAKLKNKAMLWDKRLEGFAQQDEALIALLLEIVMLARTLPASLSAGLRHKYAMRVRDAAAAFSHRHRAAAIPEARWPRHDDDAAAHPVSAALALALDQLFVMAARGPATVEATRPSHARTLLWPDAFRNRSHARFAIKVMIAVLGSYATYTLLDWPGIRTAVTTCFFVSLTTFGESMHKFALRASGAIIGGLIAGLCMVFVLPMLTDIGQLCMLIALISFFCAWISTSSEAIAYAGMQIAFAFFLGILQGYGPATDLTGLRDRVLGILIGNIWVTVVFASIWPASALGQARSLRQGVLGKLARMLDQDAPPANEKTAICTDLAHADLLQARGSFEWLRMEVPHNIALAAPQLERIVSLVFALVRLRDTAGVASAARAQDAVLAQQLIALSGHGAATTAATGAPVHPADPLGQARHLLEEAILHAPNSA